MLQYCFDTSAINRLLDDPESDALIAGLLVAGQVRTTAFNVIEVAKTECASRRGKLLQLLRRLNRHMPIDRPNTILISLCKAHAVLAPRIQLNADEGLRGLWQGLYNPELIDDSSRRELADFARTLDESFDDTAFSERPAFQDVITRNPANYTVAWTLRNFFSNEWLVMEIVNEIYKRATGKELTQETFRQMMKAQPGFTLYFAAHVYAMYQRSVKAERYSRKHATGMDMTQAVYLSICQRFVTDDQHQYRGLQFAKNFVPKAARPRVILYDTFRARLLALAG